jgi:uncharacterized membrane protein YfcA
LMAGSVPAALVTLVILHDAGEQSARTGQAISVLLGITLLLSGVATIFRARIVAFLARRLAPISAARQLVLTVLVGAILGVLVSLTSVGAGALGMTALLILYPSMPVNKLVGSDIAHAVPLTLLGGIGHYILGSVDGSLLVSLLIGSIPGIIVGSLVASRISDRYLSPILAAVLAAVGIKLLYG